MLFGAVLLALDHPLFIRIWGTARTSGGRASEQRRHPFCSPIVKLSLTSSHDLLARLLPITTSALPLPPSPTHTLSSFSIFIPCRLRPRYWPMIPTPVDRGRRACAHARVDLRLFFSSFSLFSSLPRCCLGWLLLPPGSVPASSAFLPHNWKLSRSSARPSGRPRVAAVPRISLRLRLCPPSRGQVHWLLVQASSGPVNVACFALVAVRPRVLLRPFLKYCRALCRPIPS